MYCPFSEKKGAAQVICTHDYFSHRQKSSFFFYFHEVAYSMEILYEIRVMLKILN